MNRAYSILDIKSVNEEERVIEGIASTPTPDRMGDIVEPMGAEFKLPMPLLWQHRSSEPVGNVTFAKPNKNGIPFKAKIERIEEPGRLKERLDEAWQSVKLGLVRAVSIGFTINAYEILKEGGWRINEWEWLELSLVTIPAQSEATINTIKSIDAELLAATGHKQNGGERTVKAGASAIRSTKIVKAKEANTMKKTIAEQISAFEATRAAKAARMTEIMDAAAEKGETLDQEAKQEYDGLESEVKSVDEHLVRLHNQEEMNKTAAVEVVAKTEAEASKSRSGVRVEVKSNVPKGIGFARLVIAKCISANEMMKGNVLPAVDVAKERWPDMPELQLALKAAVTPGSSTTMSTMVEPQILSTEFIDYLWHRTIIGRIPGLRKVPFNIKVQRALTVASVNWVGEGKPKPLGRGTLDTVTLGYTKIAGIVPLTDELVRFSNPSVEAMVRDQLASGIVQLMDHDFMDPEKALVANVSPASITNGVTGVSATGTAYANVAADVGTALGNFDAARIDTSDLVVVMNSRRARALSLSLNSLGQKLFPDLTTVGGTFLGYPVVVSGNIDYTEDSPAEGDSIFFIKPSDILLADDGGVDISISREASVQMDSAPDDPATASTVLVSAFQHNLVLIRAERFVNWLKARDAAVQYIKAANYV